MIHTPITPSADIDRYILIMIVNRYSMKDSYPVQSHPQFPPEHNATILACSVLIPLFVLSLLLVEGLELLVKLTSPVVLVLVDLLVLLPFWYGMVKLLLTTCV